MSYFAVEKKKIGWVGVHTNAERLSLAKVEGIEYQFVTGKDEFKIGDDVIYFPIDSELPKDLSDYLNVTSFLTGKDHNRVKTAKLRGQISQGICVPAKKIDEFLQIKGLNNMVNGEDYTAILGVTKYEPPAIIEQGGRLVRLPEGVESYDVEGCDNYPDVVAYLMDKKVYVSEKVEGSNHGVTVTSDGKVIVNQHNYAIEPAEGTVHTWIKTAENCGVVDLAKKIQTNDYPGKQVTVRTEILGGSIQGNIYKLTEYTVRIYDIKIDGVYISCDEYFKLLDKYGMTSLSVPVIAKDITLGEWLGGKTVQEASNGKSVLNPEILREGVVIKPMVEEKIEIGKFQGRLIIKQRSPEYLAKEK